MEKTFQRVAYKSKFAYSLTHTIGSDASGSTNKQPHYNTSYVFFFLIRGKCEFKIEGQQYHMLPGDLIFIDPSELFCNSVDSTCFHERIILRIHTKFPDNFSFDCASLFDFFRNREKGIGNLIPAQSLSRAGIDQRFHRLLSLHPYNNPINELQAICTIADIVADLNKLCSELDISMRKSASHGDLTQSVILYLNEHFREHITVGSVADSFGVTASYLSHDFKSHTGISLWNYVILRRLQFANELLAQGVSSEEACFRSGFQNYANFYRLYKKNLGITPTQYRQSNFGTTHNNQRGK